MKLTYGVLRSRRHLFRYQICGDLGEPRAEGQTSKPLLGEIERSESAAGLEPQRKSFFSAEKLGATVVF